MEYQIEYYSDEVAQEILSLPDTLAARYIVLTRRMAAIGANLGPPHTDSFGEGRRASLGSFSARWWGGGS